MKIAVFGLGNVGLVAALGLCKLGHKVVGIEVSQWKVEKLLKGEVYIHEKGLEELLITHKDHFKASSDLNEAKNADCFIVCVGTPSKIDGEVNLGQIQKTFREMTEIMSDSHENIIILRSTIPPGTIRSLVLPLLRTSQKPFKLVYHPEFLREGTAVEDFLKPNLHVLGLDPEEEQIPCPELFENAEEIRAVKYETAEMLKYVNNSFHALKVSFINEIASLASTFSVDVTSLIDVFLADEKLNISRKYLRPGFAFGGPCFIKELKAINHFSKSRNVEAPLLSSIISSNEEHIIRTLKKIEKLNPSKILFFGVCFKEETDDLRFSPIIELIKQFERGPSYLKKKEIYIRDYESVLLQKPEIAHHHLIKNCHHLPEDIELVVLGSFWPDKDDRKWLAEYNGPVIDLCFYEKDLVLKNTPLKAYEVS